MTAALLSFPAPISGDALALDEMARVTRERAAVWASERLWGTTAPLRFDPSDRNRRMVAQGTTLVGPDETGVIVPVTVAIHDATFRHDGDGPTTVSYLI